MKRLLLSLACTLASAYMWAQVPYGYAPNDVSANEISALGGNKNEFVQGVVLFDPATDPVWARMKGKQVLGVRCYVRADYKQARQKRSGILACSGNPANIVQTTYADLTEGWNDVLFAVPLTIGDERLYLGVQTYETIGTPYPLVAYAAATVPQSCIINLGKKAWEEFTDRGTLLIAALVQDDAAGMFEHAVYAQNTTHPQTVAPDTDFQGGLYIHNFGTTPLTDIVVAMQGEGAVQPTLRAISLPTPVPAYGSTVVSTLLRSGTAEGTNVSWTATVTQANGVETQPARPGTTSLFVTKDNFIRTPLIEEFTSQRCVNCPQMAYFLEKALEQYGKPYVYVAHHSGFAEDVFTTAPDREAVYVFGGYANEYNPAIMYNRTVFEGENTIVFGIRDMSPTPYLDALALAADMPAKAEVQLEHDDATVTVSGRVARDLVGTPLYLSCYLVEDGIGTNQYPQMGMDDDDAPADLKEVFRHNGVILHHFNTNAIGDPLVTNADGSYSVSYPLAKPNGYGGTAQRLVAFVHQVNKDNLRANEVLNATQEYLTGAPNAIRDIQSAQLSQHHTDAIYDLSGRRIRQSAASIRQAPLHKGIYIAGGRKVVR